jgi:3-dehydrosphinganine reductase
MFELSLWSFLLYGSIGAVTYSLFVDYFVTPRPKLTDYKNKHVLITGGSAGLGKSLAIKLAKVGANITILARDAKKLEAAKKEIEVLKRFQDLI